MPELRLRLELADYEVLQFGRTGQDTFSMDVQHPMSLVQVGSADIAGF